MPVKKGGETGHYARNFQLPRFGAELEKFGKAGFTSQQIADILDALNYDHSHRADSRYPRVTPRNITVLLRHSGFTDAQIGVIKRVVFPTKDSRKAISVTEINNRSRKAFKVTQTNIKKSRFDSKDNILRRKVTYLLKLMADNKLTPSKDTSREEKTIISQYKKMPLNQKKLELAKLENQLYQLNT